MNATSPESFPTRTRGRSSFPYFTSFALVALTAAGLCGCDVQKPAAHGPVPEVEFAVVEQRNVPLTYEWVGTLQADVNATISAQVTGYITNRAYSEGLRVTNGQVLFQIDSAFFETSLANARAQLAQAEAVKAKSKLDRDRYTPLASSDAISKQELDQVVQQDQSAQAQVDAAKAGVMQAELNLGFATIRSPIDGVSGLAKAQVGDLVGPGSGPLTSVSKIDPIRALFSVSEQVVYRTLERRAAAGGPGGPAKLPLELLLADGETYPEPGETRFSDNQVDVKTGTIQVVGEFPNHKGILLPGMFARVRALVGVQTNALLVPQRAVTELQGKYLVAVVGPDDQIKILPVKVGETVQAQWIIESASLKAGDRVVAEGIQKVRDGMTVKPVPFTAMEAKRL